MTVMAKESTSPGSTVLAATAPAVRVSGLTKAFARDGDPVLDDVSLDVAPGEFVCVLGASGCGKSTLLNLIAGLETPTSGTVEVPSGRPALMFQEPALFPWLSAGRNIELALRLRGVPRRERRAEAERLLSLVRLDDAADKRVAALDAITRDVLHDELTRLWTETGLSIVFVTHNVREAVRLGQRVILFSSRPGRIVREWPVYIPQPRRIESPDVAELSLEITDHLRQEIRRHGRH